MSFAKKNNGLLGRIRILTVLTIFILMGISHNLAFAQQADFYKIPENKLPLLKTSENGHFLMYETGEPFFWLGDTGWSLFKSLSQKDADFYLKDRKAKGFTVIQAAVFIGRGIEPRGIQANVYGHKPFMKKGDGKQVPNDLFFDHVDYIVDKAEEVGLYIAMVPVWADHYVRKDTGFFNASNTREAYAYGLFLGKRYRDKPIIWVLGGDHYDEGTLEVWREMARGLKEGDLGKHLITYHPRGYERSSKWFHNEDWLDFNMIQTGHLKHNTGYLLTLKDYLLTPAKPTIIGEAGYEGITDGLKQKDPDVPLLDETDVRRYAYLDVFAGAAGVTYGCNEVFQFWRKGKENFHSRFPCQMSWKLALNRQGAHQMQFLRELIESRPMIIRIPDQSMIVGDAMNTLNRIQAMRASGGSYAFVYSSSGANVVIDLGKMSGAKVEASWYNPRTGESTLIGEFNNSEHQQFMSPSGGVGYDWVLILDAK